MIRLDQAVIAEKNKLASDSAELLLLEINIPGLDEPIRIVINTEAVEWSGRTWTYFPVEIGDITEDSKGEQPSISLKINNTDRTIHGYAESSQGGVGGTCTIYVVNSKHLNVLEPLFQEEFAITKSVFDQSWGTFTLGTSYPLSARRPLRRFLKNHCPFEYGDIECGVSHAVVAQYPKCDRTLNACRIRGNSVRFGGEPAIPGGFYA
jgi:Phage-related protein